MMTAAVASTVVPPVASLVAAVLLLLVLVTSMVVLRRRSHSGEVPATADLLDEVADLPDGDQTHEAPSDEASSPVGVAESVEAAAEDSTSVAAAGPHDELSSDDPRALRMLVRTLEAAIEELSTDLHRMTTGKPAPAPTAGVSAPADPDDAPRPSDVRAERHVRAIGEALQGAPGGDLAARVNAALVRRGVPRTFARPALAACIGQDLPVVRPVAAAHDAGVSASDPGTPAGLAPEDVGPASEDGPPIPDDDEPLPEQSDAPAEPERVMPVPAPPATAPTTRRGLFRRPVA